MNKLKKLKKLILAVYSLFKDLLFDPGAIFNKWRAFPYFFRNLKSYQRKNQIPSLRFHISDMQYTTSERFASAGTITGHYFHQDLWAAKYLFDNNIKKHVDAGSRLDGFIAHILLFCEVSYVDIRPLTSTLKGLEFKKGSLSELPFNDNSVPSISSLHVIEHVGLGRYGDAVDPYGHLKAAKELARVLAPGGRLLLSTTIGRERLCFDAHRIFDPQTIVDAFGGLKLVSFSLIDDKGEKVKTETSFDEARRCYYGCGLFVFTK